MPTTTVRTRAGAAKARALYNAQKPCSVSGCTQHRDGFSRYCAVHRKRLQHQGHPLQRPIMAKELEAYEQRVLLDWQRLKASTGTDPFDIMAANWKVAVKAAKDQLEMEKAGLAPANSQDSRNHLVDLVCLEGVEVSRWVPRIIALHLFQDDHPGEFQTDSAFFVQIGKLVWMKRHGVREASEGVPGWFASHAAQRGQLPSLRRREAMGRTLSAYAGKAIAHSLSRHRQEKEERAAARGKADEVFCLATI